MNTGAATQACCHANVASHLELDFVWLTYCETQTWDFCRTLYGQSLSNAEEF